MAESDAKYNPYTAPFRWVSLGISTTLNGLLYPIALIYRPLGDALFQMYHVNDDGELGVNMDTSRKSAATKKRELKKQKSKIEEFYDNLWYVKQHKAALEEGRALLISTLTDEVRSEKPVTYRYTAYTPTNKKEINTFYAYSKMEVFSYLENEGFRVLKIETSQAIELMYGPTSFMVKKFNNKDLIFWITQLSTYLKSGIPLINSMRILSKQMAKDPNKKRVFDAIIYNLTLGESFSDSLDKQGKVFPPLLTNMIKAAEATGELESTLDEMSEYYSEMETTRKQMVSAMTYPLIILIFSMGVVSFILLYVIPQFQSVYAEAGAELNPFTLFVLAASNFLENNILYIILFIIAGVVTLIVSYQKIKSFRIWMQRFLMKLPVVGDIIIFKEMTIFAKTFSSLLKNNVYITESIELLTNITNNEIYRTVMIETIENVAAGDKISDAFEDHWAVPDIAYYMIVTGESTGELADMMARVADYYQQSHKAVINTMKSFIEPAMIVFLAVVVGGIIMAVILPMFGLYSEIG